MDIDELRQKQANFEGIRQDRLRHYKELGELQNKFINTFPLLRIADLKIDDYVEGKPNKNSFCYWVEYKTKTLGGMQGATAKKFGIYFDKKSQNYKFIKKYKNPNEAFNSIKTEIANLIRFGEKKDLNEIKKINLSPMFKAKILFLYYPEKYINIFSEEWVDYYLKSIGVFSENLDIDLIDKRELLYKFKVADTMMKNWKMWEFSDFLYNRFGKPTKKENTPPELKDYIDFDRDYPNLNDVNPEFIGLEIDESQNFSQINRYKKISHQNKIVDFEKENRRNKRLGERGELIVLKSERNYLNKTCKTNLANKVRHISKENMSAGYDILSFEQDGHFKHIEVKSTSISPSRLINFILTVNKYEKAKKLENFYIYIVFEAKTKKPKIGILKNPFKLKCKGIILTPLNFRVEISIDSKQTIK